MIDPSSASSPGSPAPSPESYEAPPILPPPLPAAGGRPPVPVHPRSRRRGLLWGVAALGLVGCVSAGMVVVLTARSRAQERAAQYERAARAAEEAQARAAAESAGNSPGAAGQPVRQFAQNTAGSFSGRVVRTDNGVRHLHDRIDRVPWSIHIVEVDRSRKDLGFRASLAADKVLGVSRISEMARALPRSMGRAVAIVNGDFYERDNRTYAGDPRGLQIVDGELVSSTSTAAVWFDEGGNPHVEDVRDALAVTFADGRKLPVRLNEQRRMNNAVIYTPTYGDSTRVSGGRDVVLEKVEGKAWLPLRPNETYEARVREVLTTGNARLNGDTIVLSVGPSATGQLPELAPGATVTLSTALTPDLKGVTTAIAGGPALVQDGKPFADTAPPPGSPGAYSERSKYERHPRSAIGWNDQKIYLITVDGRQPGLSVGMTLAELADYMVKKLNCTGGMNFDGGASASLWMSGSIINDPSQGERAVANGLIVYRKAATP